MAEQRILLVDDQPKTLAMYGKVLEKGGFAVTAADSGREAFQKMKDEPIDLVLADVVMPRIDGLEILKQVGAEYPGVPGILRVGGLTNEILLEAAEFGAAQTLGKPVKPGTLLRSVRQALRARRESTGHLRKSGSTESQAVEVTATRAKNRLGQMLDQLSNDKVVFITRHNSPKAALVSMEKYMELTTSVERKLNTLSKEFDEMLAAMQTPKAREGMKSAFDATPRQLGEAALKAARNRD